MPQPPIKQNRKSIIIPNLLSDKLFILSFYHFIS
nr:MAG TPA: hypothetical protein [Caudoviricetes sp.]